MIMGFSVILMILFYHPPSFRQLHGHERTRMQEVKRVDWVGMLLLVAGLVLFLLGVSWGECYLTLHKSWEAKKSPTGGQPLSWSSSRILGLLISGVVVLIAFGFWEVYSHTPNPLVPMHFFKDVRGFTMLFIICGVSGVTYTATAIIWPSQVAYVFVIR